MPVYSLLQLLCILASVQVQPSIDWPKNLSEWDLFKEPLKDLIPQEGVMSYTVNAPLYSDYAFKTRFIRLPDGKTMRYHPSDAFEMPEGTVLVKNFIYHYDDRDCNKGRRIIETRLIVKKNDTWHAVAYRWNDEQTEADRAIAGGSTDIAWTDYSGRKKQLHYLIPDANQCKNCHNKNDILMPLGITARQLYPGNEGEQMRTWIESGMLTGAPVDLNSIHRLIDYEDESQSLDKRARSYLDANCAHCHSPNGSARTSGLHLNFDETDPHAIGVMKAPVAAGRGSGGRLYSIVPGKPSQSILLYRMESNDPGIRMPEINRQIAHSEGIELIKDWIRMLNVER